MTNFVPLVGWRGGGGWDWLSAGGVGFHEFDASAVGVEDVDLTLAVDADVHVERFAAAVFRVVFLPLPMLLRSVFVLCHLPRFFCWR